MEVIEGLGDAADAEFGSGFFKTPPEITMDFTVLAGGRRGPEEVSPTCP